MIIIDGENAIFGRLCSYAAKQALSGEEVVVVNSDKVLISGNKKDIIKKYSELRELGGHSKKGPKIPKVEYKMLKRGIRGMLPDHRKGQGRDAYKRVMCHNGVPKEFEGKEMIKIKRPIPSKYIELNDLVKKI